MSATEAIPSRLPRTAVSAIAAGLDSLRERWLEFLIISGIVLIPCFWHRHLEAADLSSHTYNAWLAQLIRKGQAPGLFLARQTTNILFDLTLSGLGSLFGLAVAEKIAVSAAVLIFFWGAFVLACSVTQMARPGRIPWFLTLVLAALAYGYTFESGFMNFYLSIGLAFWGLAAIVRTDPHSVRAALPNGLVILCLLPFTWLANPLGTAVLVSAGAYLFLAKLVPAKRQLLLFSAAAFTLLVMHFIIKRHLDVPSAAWNLRMTPTGADQLLIWGPRYFLPAYSLEFLFLVSLLADAVDGWRAPQWRSAYLVPVQLFCLALLAVLTIPHDGLQPPQHLFGKMNAILFIKQRLTSVTAVFGCCVLAQIKPRLWHYVGFAAVAAVFFSFLYRDTSIRSDVEDQMQRLTATLPFGQRVIEKTMRLPGFWSVVYIPERACIGHCYFYGNYEPASGQFRVRARPENPFVLSTNEDVDAVRLGQYVVKPRDLPLYEVYQCTPDVATVCLRELYAGQVSGQIETSAR
jgi:hypothetical protein